jgi:hypothetical protein
MGKMVPMVSGTGVAAPPRARQPAWLDSWLGEGPETRFPLLAAVGLLTALFVGPLLVAALVLEEPSAVFWALLIVDLAAVFFFAVATISAPVLFIGVLIVWFALQRLVVALVAPHIDADMVRVLLTYKEGFYFILPAAAVLSTGLQWLKGNRAVTAVTIVDLVAVTWLGILALHFFAAGDPSTPVLTYARRFAAPVLLFVGGRLLVPHIGQFRASLRLVVAVAVAVSVFGLIERFLFGVGFWADAVDARVFYEKQVESGLLPENWTMIYRGVPDGIFIALPLEEPVRRLVSSYMEPTTLASFLAFSLLMVLLAPGMGRETSQRNRIYAAAGVIVLAVALLATLSRGGMVTVLVGGALFVVVRVISERGWPAGMPVALGAFVAILMSIGVVITTFSTFPGDGLARDVLATRAVSGLTDEPPAPPVAPPVSDEPPVPGALEEIIVHPPGSTAEGAGKHLDGLRSGLDRMLDDPLGAGLGAAGNWSDAPEAGGESGVGVIAAQLGVAGFFLYVGFFLAAAGGLVAVAWRNAGPLGDVALVIGGAMLGLFLMSFVSESASGLLGNAPYFIFAGWMFALALPVAERLRFVSLRSPLSRELALDPSSRQGDTSTG